MNISRLEFYHSKEPKGMTCCAAMRGVLENNQKVPAIKNLCMENAMPYIKQEYRPRLDTHIEALAKEIRAIAGDDKTAFAGLLNYSATRLAIAVCPARSYWVIAIITGVFKNIADEFYRRVGVPYEDEKIKANGDVY